MSKAKTNSKEDRRKAILEEDKAPTLTDTEDQFTRANYMFLEKFMKDLEAEEKLDDRMINLGLQIQGKAVEVLNTQNKRAEARSKKGKDTKGAEEEQDQQDETVTSNGVEIRMSAIDED